MRARGINRIAGVIATTVLAAVTAAPHADAMSAGGGAFTISTPPAAAHGVRATMSYDATPFANGTWVEFNCKAVAWVDPAATGIDTCSIDGVEALNSPNNYPGAVAVAAGVVFVPDGATPSGCVAGHATFLEGRLGPIYDATETRCQPLILVELADA